MDDNNSSYVENIGKRNGNAKEVRWLSIKKIQRNALIKKKLIRSFLIDGNVIKLN